jgi:hypothetical protein
MRPRPLPAFLAACAAALACGVEPSSQPPAAANLPEATEGSVQAPSAVDTPAPSPGSAASARRTAATPKARSDGPGAVPLERLLALPPYRQPDAPDLAELLRQGAAAPDAPTAARRSRLRFDLARRIDAPIERDLKREQVDAGVALDVGGDTRVRGGVRVQRDTAESVESTLDTTPSIGIEKRF